MSKQKASDVMLPIKDVVSVEEEDLTQKACGELVQKKIGSVLVRDKQKQYIGIITKTDVASAVWDGRFHHKKGDLVKVQEDDELSKVIDYMNNSNVHHVVVKDFEKTIVGLISSRDVAKYLMKKDDKDDQSLLRKIFGIKK